MGQPLLCFNPIANGESQLVISILAAVDPFSVMV